MPTLPWLTDCGDAVEETAAFFSHLRALSDAYVAVVAERDRLKTSEPSPPSSPGPSPLPITPLKAPPMFPQKPQKEAPHVARPSGQFFSEESNPPQRSISLTEGSADGMDSEHNDVMVSTGSNVKISTPTVLQKPKVASFSSAASLAAGPGMKPKASRRSTKHFSSRIAFVLDRRWRDLYYANEHEAEFEEGATLTFRQEALASSAFQRTSRLNSGNGIARGAGGPSTSSLLERVDASEEDLSPFQRFVLYVPLRPTDIFVNIMNLVLIAMILSDLVMLPVALAWDFDYPPLLSVTSFLFWCFDMAVKFNLAHYAMDGSLISKRLSVTKMYLKSWFVFDLLLLCMDLVLLSVPLMADMSAMRFLRALRMFRLLRLIKAWSVRGSLEGILSDLGMANMVLLFGVFETMCWILLLAHILACSWYGLGRLSLNNGSDNWLLLHGDLAQFEVSDFYTKSMYWVLGHLVAAPVDTTTAPQNQGERVFTIGLICCSLLVVGSGISKMTNTFAELHRSHLEAVDASRYLRQRLRGTDRVVIARITRFALHSLRRRHELCADQAVISLLSKSMATEVEVWQRRAVFESHGLFAMVKDYHPGVFVSVCDAFKISIFADHELVFAFDTVSEHFYCTMTGVYHYGSLQETAEMLRALSSSRVSTEHRKQIQVEVLEQSTCLCEVNLYCKKLHQGELRTSTFADALVLYGADFANCVRTDPKCVGLMYRYAQELFAFLIVNDTWNCEVLSMDTVDIVCEKLRSITSPSCVNLDSPSVERASIDQFLHELESAKDDHFFVGEYALHDELLDLFPEVSPGTGIYDKLGEGDERLRAVACISSFVWLVRGNYERFTERQPPSERMTLEQWKELRQFLRWADLSSSELHAMLVFLVMRGLGKVKAFLHAMVFEDRFPEMVMKELLYIMPRQTPSKCHLIEPQISLLDSVLDVHKAFNLAQLLQGENTPYQVTMLQELSNAHGPRVFKFSLLALVAVMFGIRGVEWPHGSLIMNNNMTTAVLTACRVLEQLGCAEPRAIYWSFITSRAEGLGLPTQSEEDLVLCRLACLIRASRSVVRELKAAWHSLHWHERRQLVAHFLADGVAETVFVFTFLPLYLANAQANHIIGLRRAFVVLTDILTFLERGAFAEVNVAPSITVNLQDLGPFTKEAQNPQAFMAVMNHSSIIRRGNELVLQISTQHKENASEEFWESDTAKDTLLEVRHINRALTSALDPRALRIADEYTDLPPLTDMIKCHV